MLWRRYDACPVLRGSRPARAVVERSSVTHVSSQESFKKSWRGWITSSEGYSLRVGSRTGIDWRDAHGILRIDSEVMSKPWNEIVVYTGSIPDTPERPRSEVLERLRRSFEFMGWQLTLEDAWFD